MLGKGKAGGDDRTCVAGPGEGGGRGSVKEDGRLQLVRGKGDDDAKDEKGSRGLNGGGRRGKTMGAVGYGGRGGTMGEVWTVEEAAWGDTLFLEHGTRE